MTDTTILTDKKWTDELKWIADLNDVIGSSSKILDNRHGAVSVWSCRGVPRTKGGLRGAHRGTLFIMPWTAESGEVITRFIHECERTDQVDYDSAEVEALSYQGWAWLPGYPVRPPAKLKVETEPKQEQTE